jgi:hypothetical protein
MLIRILSYFVAFIIVFDSLLSVSKASVFASQVSVCSSHGQFSVATFLYFYTYILACSFRLHLVGRFLLVIITIYLDVVVTYMFQMIFHLSGLNVFE